MILRCPTVTTRKAWPHECRAKLLFDWNRIVGLGRLCHFAITDIADDFQDLAPGGELATAATLVIVHRLHEFDFVWAVVALAGRRVNLTTAFDFSPFSALQLCH